MKSSVKFLCGLVLIFLVGCQQPIRVKSYWSASFERMRHGATYAWGVSQQAVDMPVVESGLLDFLHSEVDRGLTEMGYVLNTGEERPDFLISLDVGSSLQPSSEGPTQVALMTLEARAASGRLLWRGWAEGRVDSSHPPEVRRELVQRAIHQTLLEFAPEKEKKQ